MTKSKTETVVLKLGGSVITYKNGNTVRLRRKLLKHIAKELKQSLKAQPNIQLILIHGAGSAGHQIAKRLDLKNGVHESEAKLKGALKIRLNNQMLNASLMDIFAAAGLKVMPVHTGSVVVQQSGQIKSWSDNLVAHTIENNCIPLLYGEMVYDTKLGLSVCSGDTLSAYLADRFKAERILFATDVDGVYDKDPYRHKESQLITEITKEEVLDTKRVQLSESHSVDVTGGLLNKIISVLSSKAPRPLREVVIFNGLKVGNFKLALSGKSIGTKIKV